MRVRQLARATDDGYRNGLVPGLKASADAERLVDVRFGLLSCSGSRQIGQFWMKRLWRQNVGTAAHRL